jgi:23S rRNA pseudouridine1911/1915/1917 synthase
MLLNETHIVTEELVPTRLQEYGVGIFQRISTKSSLKKAIKKKLVYVNGTVASTATIIIGGETIEYRHVLENHSKTRLKLKLEVVYEDDYFAVINKPAGILVSGNGFKTVANALEQNLKCSSHADSILPQPAHRLDYATTGLLLVGKTSTVLTALNKLFEHKKIYKTYYAVTIGAMEACGTINTPIDGKPASSSFQVVQSVSSKRFNFLNLVELSPNTGRRHQLRKHLLGKGNPILGDGTYFINGLQLKGKGLYLHAYTLQFVHPITNENMQIVSKIPESFKKLFSKLS